MAEVTLTEQQQLQEIDLSRCNWSQLTNLKLQLEQDLTVLHRSVQSLKVAQNKFQGCNECLDKFTPEAKGIHAYYIQL